MHTSLYADDSDIWKSGKNISLIKDQIQDRLKEITNWTEKLGLKIYPSKTISIIFTRKIDNLPNFSRTINKQSITPVNEAKFLGLTFDRQLLWKKHINLLVEKLNKYINLLRYISNKTWGASERSLHLLFTNH